MISTVDASYWKTFRDGRITREDAQHWMAEKKSTGVSRTAELIMWQNIDQFEGTFDPGVKEEVEAFLADEAKARYRQGEPLLTRFFDFLNRITGGKEADLDRDGVSDREERRLNTNPFRAHDPRPFIR